MEKHAGPDLVKERCLTLAKKISSENTEIYREKALGVIPTRDIQGGLKRLRDKLGSYPLYAFFLYTEMDEDLVAFMRYGYWLHSLSGNDCLISVFENPGEWGEQWKSYWQEKLGSDFDQISADWYKLQPLDRDSAFSLADLLGVEKNTIPCIVFLESFEDKKLMCIPIIADKTKYKEYFQALFAAVSRAARTPVGKRLQALQKEWRKVWVRLILPEKIRSMAKSIQDWRSVIIDTKDTIVALFDLVTPLINRIGAPQ
jgi:hypothetical protein